MSDLALKVGEDGEILIPLKLKQPTHHTAKLSRAKQKKFLQFYAQTPNITKAAANIGLNRQIIYRALENNPDFANAFNEIKEAKNDDVRETIITMAVQPTREAFNYTKLYAEANIPEYKRNPDTVVAIQINTSEATTNLSNLAGRLPEMSVKKALPEKNE
jgi:hypothetical protein